MIFEKSDKNTKIFGKFIGLGGAKRLTFREETINPFRKEKELSDYIKLSLFLSREKAIRNKKGA